MSAPQTPLAYDVERLAHSDSRTELQSPRQPAPFVRSNDTMSPSFYGHPSTAVAPSDKDPSPLRRNERVLVHSPAPCNVPQPSPTTQQNPSQADVEDSITGEADYSDYFSAVSAYKAQKAATNQRTDSAASALSTTAEPASSSSFPVARPSAVPYKFSRVASQANRRWPSSGPEYLQNDSRNVSAPLPHRQGRRPSAQTFGPSPLQQGAGRRNVSFSSSHNGTDLPLHNQDVQTPLPLYHSDERTSTSRTVSSSFAHVQQYDQSAPPIAITPFDRAGQTSSNGSFYRSAMKPTSSMSSQTEIGGLDVPQSSNRPSSVLGGAFAMFYDRMTGNRTVDDGQLSPKSRSPGDIPPPPVQDEHCPSYVLDHHDEPMEPDDPRITGVRRKSVDVRRDEFIRQQERAKFFSPSEQGGSVSGGSSSAGGLGEKRSKGIAGLIDPIKNSAILNGGLGGKDEKRMRKYHSSVLAHIDERRRLVLKMARALMFFGAPSHRVESQLNALARVLDVDAQFIHFPGIVIANFGDFENNTSQCHFVKSKTEIALGRLTELHNVYKALLADNMTVLEAAQTLDILLKSAPEWSNLSRILFSIVKCGMMAPINFGGSFVDVWISALFGGLLTFSQLCLTGHNQMFSNTFDIAVAIVFSFLSRLLSVKSVFCYEAIASSGLISLLPGYAVLCASLELASKNMMAGSVRMVYAIIYSLFLGFAIAIGSELYYFVDPTARDAVMNPVAVEMTQIVGSFVLSNQTTPYWNGTFSFTNTTSNAAQSAGSIVCARQPDWPWWRQTVPPISKAATVPIFSLLSCLSFLLPLRSREVPVSVVIACIGFAANALANKYIFDRSDVVSAIGSFIIGVLGNAYSRIWNATAFTAITVAVNFLVPTGMAMAGGLAMTYKGSDGDVYTNGLSLGFRMVQVSIGITTGLFVSALLVHMLGNKRSNAVLFAF